MYYAAIIDNKTHDVITAIKLKTKQALNRFLYVYNTPLTDTEIQKTTAIKTTKKTYDKTHTNNQTKERKMIRHYYATINREKSHKTIIIMADNVILLDNIIDYVNNYTNTPTFAEKITSKTANKIKNESFTKRVGCFRYSRKNYDKIDKAIEWLML